MAASNEDAVEVQPSLVGRRVRVAGHLGTIRWGPGVLQAPPKKDKPEPVDGEGGYKAAPIPVAEKVDKIIEVAGVEYDDDGIGKHDGVYQCERLFTCPAGKGSFAKVDKLDFGVPFQRALVEKYFAALLPDAAKKMCRKEEVDKVEFTDSKGRTKSMAVELLGRYDIEKRQGRLEGFVELSLAEAQVETRYTDELWTGDWSLPNLKSLWLDKTLITDWEEVFSICELCPCLEWLSLSRTRMKPLPPTGTPLPSPLNMPPYDYLTMGMVITPYVCKIKTLVLNGTMMSWNEILALDALGRFPFLENLHLAQNLLTEGMPADMGKEVGVKDDSQKRPFPRLRSLVLDGNGITDWTVLTRAINSFPFLEALHLNENRLGESLEGLAAAASDQTPRRLTALFLNENKLATWKAIGALAGFALLELKVQRSPMTEGSTSLASPMLLRQIIIALMPDLMRLNASEVTCKERTASERYFMSISQQEGSALVNGLAEGCHVPGHVERLRKIHGDVVSSDVTEQAQASRSALSNTLVEVTLRPVATSICEKPNQRKKVPHTMTVGELKRLAQLLFKQVPLDRIKLTLVDGGAFALPLEEESRELGFYGIGDGAEVRVDDSGDLLPESVAKK
mmetsp:Transcript_34139/g.61436  ORF Transcript_34139/g.61436 Transcript_34139/m.61436 type:complete len:622 (-) Transcript_34139:53-1918(-)